MMTDMFLQIDNSKAGKYAFALTGRGLHRYTRLPRVSLRLPWAMRSLGFQPAPAKSGRSNDNTQGVASLALG